MNYGKSKIFAAVFLAGALLLTGCGESGNENEPAPTATEQQESTESTEQPVQETASTTNETETSKTPEKENLSQEVPKDQTEKTSSESSAPEQKNNAPKETEKKPEVKTETKPETSAPQTNTSQETKVENPLAEQPATPPAETKPSSKYKDGNHSGSADGYNGPITVSVTIKSDNITSITITNHSDDDVYIADAQAVISKIIQSQSASVDSVSGATYSSDGIKNAVKAALEKAKN